MKIRLAAAAVVLASAFSMAALPAAAAPVEPVATTSAVVTSGDSTDSFFCAWRIRMFCARMWW